MNRRGYLTTALVLALGCANGYAGGAERPVSSETQSIDKSLHITQPYLVWPVQRQAKGAKPDCRFFLHIDDELFTYADVQLPQGEPDFWVFTDLSQHQGKTLRIRSDLHGDYATAFEQVVMSDEVPGMEDVYREALRPQYHFSSKRGWLNDANGMTYYDGEWHLFYQHNPYNWHWCNISWGHAVSRDLLHWEELPDAIVPGSEGVIYSGSGAIDFLNDAGFQAGKDPVMLLAYTGNGLLSYLPGLNRVQCLAYSNDRGRTFTKYAKNPVIPNLYNRKDRDPKIFRHEPSGDWVMVYWENGGQYHVNVSEDLKTWVETDVYKSGGAECPDMFEMPVDGDWSNTKWLVWSGNGRYKLGSFDGKVFRPETDVQRSYFGNAYAGQTFSHAPDRRRIHIGWLREDQPGFAAGHAGMPFNQQMTLPLEFTLRSSPDGPRLFIEAVDELKGLRETSRAWTDLRAGEGEDPLSGVQGDQVEIEVEFELGTAEAFGLLLRGRPVGYDVATSELVCDEHRVKVQPVDGRIRLRIFLDTTSIEAFVNEGEAYLSAFRVFDPGDHAISMYVRGGEIRVPWLKVHTLRSIWPG